MNREVHVRIREGLGVQFPGPTRRTTHSGIPTAIVLTRWSLSAMAIFRQPRKLALKHI
jgi:hypothetical protein